jgi:mannitol/fructose-specific phosphotransferase system IIA component (Ntr-type)
MTLAQFTEPKLIVPRLLGTHRESAIMELSGRLEIAERIENFETFAHDVLQHEALASAEFSGVAFPLTRGRAARELSFALGFARQPIVWGNGRATKVHTVVLLAVPQEAGQQYLSFLLTFSNFIKNEAAFVALRYCVNPKEIMTLLGDVRLLHTGPSQVGQDYNRHTF